MFEDVVCSEVHHDQLYQSYIDTDIFGDSGNNDTIEDSRSVVLLGCTSIFQTCPMPDEASEKDKSFEITLTHFRSTSISLVGLQVWRGALILADYLLAHHAELDMANARVIELAAGTGITSIVSAALGAKSVLCTDVDRGQILDTIRHNFETNGKICAKSNVKVEEIDFFRIDRWRQKLGQEIAESNLILAADVVYDQELTSRFFDALTAILEDNRSDARVLIAIECRNRVEERGKVTAPNFDHFLGCLRKFECQGAGSFSVKSLRRDFHQYFTSYERVTELNLWLIEKVTV